MHVREDRDLLSYILLSIVTCGIYSYIFLYGLAQDANTVCAGDGKSTPGLLQFVLLSFFTCGIYAWFWYYGLGNRLAETAPRYGLSFSENGTTILVWLVVGTCVCGIGQFIAMYFLIKNMNALAHAYNTQGHQ